MTGLRDGVIRRGSSWSYVIRVTDSSGANKPRWVSGFRTEADAKAARDAARVAARRGEFVDRSRITVEQYLAQWLEAHALEVKPKTHEDYRSLIATYVAPRIGQLPLQNVRPSTLSGLYRTLLAQGGRHGQPLSPRTVSYVHAVLRKAFNDAVRTDQILATNPAERAKRPKTSAIEQVHEVWDAGQLRVFLDAVSTHRLYPFFRLAAYTGARRGELLHLRWDDVRLDGDDPHIRIRGSVTMVAGKRVEGTTKSGRIRSVGLDAGTVAVMREHAERQSKERETALGSWVEGDHVFRMEMGSQLAPDVAGSLLRRTVQELNQSQAKPMLPQMRLHDLRHVHATLLLKAGVPVHVVAARLGHADPAITLRVYAHVLRDQAVEVAQIFASVVDRPLDPDNGALANLLATQTSTSVEDEASTD
ncbi:site-specific integrase [Pedococcus sp.]|uniref:tyrosine-type recombinase/integrase n=1 Tax=Pedococcus sp. TaxID=2860345 RepID=UPI002E11C8E0|nr:site-specific integrase [Pedococcus sp.]